ncbi:MAG: hypothetical protein FWD23_07055 [Oscillospiraceae bacterium]|nr:hypothetical protein [Oscillospiraceae bacterium]
MRTPRIEKLREKALTAKPNNIEWQYLYYKGYLEACKKTISTIEKYALAVNYMLSNVQPAIGPGELILGRQTNRGLTEAEAAEYEIMRSYELPLLNSILNNGHMAIDYEYILQKGISGIKADIDGYIDGLDMTKSGDLEKRIFYGACKTALDGVLKYAGNYVSAISEAAGECGDEKRKKELLKLAEVFSNIPDRPASSFYEALQCAWFMTICVSVCPMALFQLGRPDRYLIRHYKKDIEEGALTKDEAQELIECACVMYNEVVPAGLACGFMVGGRGPGGADTSNELSYMFIESISHTAMIYPGIGLCCNEDTPPDLLELSVETLGNSHSHPALFNDDIIQKGLKYYGLEPAEACSYIHSTCVEITPVASSGVWVASPYTNLVALLLDVMGVKSGGEPVRFDNIGQLKQAYFKALKQHIKNNFIEFNKTMIERTRSFAQPLLSCFVNDCLKTGRDIEWGGARYNWIMPSFVGLANLCDSLNIIEDLVFESKQLTFADMADMLLNNFEGYEKVRAYIQNRAAKYGNDDDAADSLVLELSEKIAEFCEGYENCRRGRLVPSLFCWIMHERLGAETIASPDGRLAKFPLGDGSGPAQGSEKNGPTASVLSSTKWEHHKFIGGVAVNMKFSKKNFTGESKKKLLELINTFMRRGGFEFQINVTDRETLQKARENPGNYSDLVVRIGGYSDYFTRLPKAMQEEIILRSEHEI